VASRLIAVLLMAFAINIGTASHRVAAAESITTYGEKNRHAPGQLNLFSFLVAKWQGAGKTRLPDGSQARFELTWIGRYILDGMAIADEIHSRGPDGKPYLGISFRHFDAQHGSWIIEYLNVSNSFIRRQVNSRSGSVSQDAGTIVVISEDGPTKIRERYRLADPDHFTYTTDLSRDGGRSWEPDAVEMAMTRVPDGTRARTP
jgi:hypothetical protein